MQSSSYSPVHVHLYTRTSARTPIHTSTYSEGTPIHRRTYITYSPIHVHLYKRAPYTRNRRTTQSALCRQRGRILCMTFWTQRTSPTSMNRHSKMQVFISFVCILIARLSPSGHTGKDKAGPHFLAYRSRSSVCHTMI